MRGKYFSLLAPAPCSGESVSLTPEDEVERTSTVVYIHNSWTSWSTNGRQLQGRRGEGWPGLVR